MVLAASDAGTIHSLGEICVFELSDPNVGPSGVPSLYLSSSTNLASQSPPCDFLLPVVCRVGKSGPSSPLLELTPCSTSPPSLRNQKGCCWVSQGLFRLDLVPSLLPRAPAAGGLCPKHRNTAVLLDQAQAPPPMRPTKPWPCRVSSQHPSCFPIPPGI